MPLILQRRDSHPQGVSEEVYYYDPCELLCFTISELSMVLCPTADQNDSTNATAGRLLFCEEKCSPDSKPDAGAAKW